LFEGTGGLIFLRKAFPVEPLDRLVGFVIAPRAAPGCGLLLAMRITVGNWGGG
jgi:hypothetical protein